MKNKGRKHIAHTLNTKGWLTMDTRAINKMGKPERHHHKSNRFMKKKWSKRVRGYFKTSAAYKLADNG